MAHDIHDAPTMVGGAESSDDPAATLPASGVASGRKIKPGLGRGDLLGRYVILGRLGEGGMGVVYSAYDPELDRQVAIKLVKLRANKGGLDSAGRSRLLREAQAMARLNHLNVVTVYDVGTFEESMFVAMELVEGQTVAAWMDQRRVTARGSWREVLPIFMAAGRGLQAAHAEGIVHRDFKPENVMIAEDGRVLVLDFGLARSGEGHAEIGRSGQHRIPSDALAVSARSVDIPLTVTGKLMGTPAYMSPEQFAGTGCDAASDQFSFCVSLYHALYGERPFTGDTLHALTASVLMGDLSPVPRDAQVPTWLRRVLLKGLATEPSQRYPSMTELLAELSRDRVRRRNRLWIAGGAVALIGVSSWGAARVVAGEQPCAKKRVGEAMAQVWGPTQRTALQDAFMRESKSFSEDVFAKTASALDDYAATWVVQRQAACEAGQEAGTSQSRVAGLHAACLDQRIRRVDALIRVLSEADQSMVVRALSAVESLPDPTLCEDAERYDQAAPIPDDPALQERVEALRIRLAEAQTFEATGQFKQAVELSQALLVDAREIGFEPLVAEVLQTAGSSLTVVGEYEKGRALLEEGLMLAKAHGLDRLQIELTSPLVMINTHARPEFDLALWQVRESDALIRRVGDPPILQARNLLDRARIERQRGDYDSAIEILRQAAELYEAHSSPTSSHVTVYEQLAASMVRSDRFDEAAEVLVRAQAHATDRLGVSHPTRGNLMMLQARVEASRHNTERSVALQKSALELYRGAYGDKHPNIGAVHNGLGLQYEVLGEHVLAEENFRAALAAMNQFYGAEHLQSAIVLQNLGNLLRRMGRADEALPLHETNLRLKEQSMAVSDHYEALDNLADDQRALGRCDEAVANYEEAIALRVEAGDTKITDLAYAQLGLSLCQIVQGDDREEAIARLQAQEVALDESNRAAPLDSSSIDVLANTRLALAMALRDRDGHSKSVISLASKARAYWAEDSRQHQANLALVDAWRAGGPFAMPVY